MSEIPFIPVPNDLHFDLLPRILLLLVDPVKSMPVSRYTGNTVFTFRLQIDGAVVEVKLPGSGTVTTRLVVGGWKERREAASPDPAG